MDNVFPVRLQRVTNGCRKAYELLSSPVRTLPDYLIIGAMKGGTTSLHNYLKQHPDLALHRCKEIHFFDQHHARGGLWYRSFFPTRRQRQIHAETTGRHLLSGEATPNYLFHSDVPQRVAALVPKAKIIVLLRDPVRRAFSHYQHNRKVGREPLSFPEAIAAEPMRTGLHDALKGRGERSLFSYMGRGLYAEQLERWFHYFPREQFLILQSESFFASPVPGLNQVAGFLGLRPFQIAERAPSLRVHNKGRYKDELDASTSAELTSRFQAENEKLYELLDVSWRWEAGIQLR